MSFDEIKAAVLALPDEEQLELATLLDAKLEPNLSLSKGQLSELKQELANAASDGDEGLPWETVRRELREELDAIQRARQAAGAAATA